MGTNLLLHLWGTRKRKLLDSCCAELFKNVLGCVEKRRINQLGSNLNCIQPWRDNLWERETCLSHWTLKEETGEGILYFDKIQHTQDWVIEIHSNACAWRHWCKGTVVLVFEYNEYSNTRVFEFLFELVNTFLNSIKINVSPPSVKLVLFYTYMGSKFDTYF